MKTFLAQNQFISNSVSHVPVDTGSGAVTASPHSTAAPVAIADPDGGYMGPRLSPALGTSVVSEAAVPLRAASDPAIPSSNEWRPQEAPRCTEPHDGACNCEYAQCDDFDRPDCKAKAAGLDPWPDSPTDHIHELFFYARKLIADGRRFVLDEARFLADLDEAPLFLQEVQNAAR